MHADIARQPVPRVWSVTDAEMVTVTVDGRTFQAPKEMLVIEAAERNGIYIPRFCWHNRMQPVAMCRMCLVEVEGGRGLPPSCTLQVADGMVVRTDTPAIQKAQDGVLEFLLINHPLDCPVCDRGGECPLQDQTLTFGPGETRFVEPKRHFEKPIQISDLVTLDRERCILCARCTRFTEEISGDPLIDFQERGNQTQVLTFPDEPFSSYFSGNTVQICPVGALTATPYRFRARPWDLQSTESTCHLSAVGCRMVVQSSQDQVVRHLGVDSDAVNHSWLCDKGRFFHDHLVHSDRVAVPLQREGSEWKELTWPEALDIVAQRLNAAKGRVGILGGARGTNESAAALARFAREVCGTRDIDAQMGDGLPADFVLGIPSDKRATINDLESAAAVVVIGIDLKEDLPVLFLRVRRAVRHLGAALIEVAPRATGLAPLAHRSLRARPGETAAALNRLADDPVLTRGPVVVIVGRGNLAEDPDAACAAAWDLVNSLPSAKLMPVLRRGNVHGALISGCRPEEGGRDAAGILAAAADGGLDALVLVGADPMADFPDRDLAVRALAGARFVVSLDLFRTASGEHAGMVLPVAGYAEQDGSVTNIEGRVTRIRARVTAPGLARPDWAVLAELASRMGHDLGQVGPRITRRQPSDGYIIDDQGRPYSRERVAAEKAVDAYGVRLVTTRTLYDHGAIVSRCPSLAPLATSAFVGLHPRELERLGVEPGGEITLRNGKGRLTLSAVADPQTPEGIAYVPFPHARDLVTAGEAVTEARLETPR